jgi:hypothetical protein
MIMIIYIKDFMMKKKDVRGDPYVFYKKVGDSAESLSQ